MALKNTVKAIPLTNIASSSLTANYQAINPGGLPNACFEIVFTNGSTTGVTLSYDGTTDHEYVLSTGTKILNAQTNSAPNNHVANFPIGTIVYAKGTAGTGNLYLSGYFQPTSN